jgi:hypothetical protein
MTPSISFFFAGLMLLAPPPVSPNKADADARETLRQVFAMKRPQQQAWVRELKARLEKANSLTLSAEEAAKQRDHVNSLLQQKSVSFQTALELVRQRNAREADAVHQLVQSYCSQIYLTFEGQGPTLAERREAWYRVYGLWEAAGSPSDQRDRLIAWLEGGIHSSLPGKIAPLPPDPTFTPRESPSKLARKKATTPAATGEAAKKAAQSAKPAEAAKTPGSVSPKPADTVKKPEDASGKPADTVKKPEDASGKPADMAKNPEDASGKPADMVKKPEDVSEKPAEAETIPAEPAQKPEETSKRSPEPAKRPEESKPEPAKKADEVPQKPAEPAKKADETPAKPEPTKKADVIPQKPAEPAKKADETPAKPEPAKKPAETWKRSKPSREECVVAAASAVPHRVQMPPQPAAPSQVRVNTEELTAQIAGSNLALRTLEADLDEKRAWDAPHLEAIVHRLDVVITKNRDLTLFRDLISPAEQALVGRIASPRAAITQLAARITEVRRRVEASDGAGSPSQRQAELQRLDALSVRLRKLAAEK